MTTKHSNEATHAIAWLKDGGLAHYVLVGAVVESHKPVSKDCLAFVQDCGLVSNPMPKHLFTALRYRDEIVVVVILQGVYFGNV